MHDTLFNCCAAAPSPSFKARRPGTDQPYGHAPLNPDASSLYKSFADDAHSGAIKHAWPATSQSRTSDYVAKIILENIENTAIRVSIPNNKDVKFSP
jgi:hypothetical protein